MIENLQNQCCIWVLVSCGVQDGDLVVVEIWLQVGEECLLVEGIEKGLIVFGQGMMFEIIEKGLVGLVKGEEKILDVEFLVDWCVLVLVGKIVQVIVKVIEVFELVVLVVDEVFIKSFGVKGGDVEQFCSDICVNLECELKGVLMNCLCCEVGEQLIVVYLLVEMLLCLVENEVCVMLVQQVEQLCCNGQNVGEILVDVYEGFKDVVVKCVLVGLLVGEVVCINDLCLEVKCLNEMMCLIVLIYEELEQVIEMYCNDFQLMFGLQNCVMEEQVIDWIVECVQYIEEKLLFQDVICQ